MNGKTLTFFQYTRQIIDKWSIAVASLVSVLSVCSKIFEKFIFDAIFEFMIENNLLSNNLLVLTNLFQKLIAFLVHLTLIHHWKFVTSL